MDVNGVQCNFHRKKINTRLIKESRWSSDAKLGTVPLCVQHIQIYTYTIYACTRVLSDIRV